jgi:hypothetical protein
VILKFGAFDAWYEEDERRRRPPARLVRPRIDILHSSRSIRVERDGELLAA